MTGQALTPSKVSMFLYPMRLTVLVIVYAVTGKLGLAMALDSPQITLIWAPSGIALACLLRWGRAYWPGVWLGAMVVSLWLGTPFWVAFAIACGNTGEALIGVVLLRRAKLRLSLTRRRDVMYLLIFGALLPTTIAATVGVGVLKLAGITSTMTSMAWLGWWLGDACGVLLVAPFLLTMSVQEPNPDKRILSQGYLILLALTVISPCAFTPLV